jgi:putative flippase GtrA
MGVMKFKRLDLIQLTKYLILGGVGASADSTAFFILNHFGVSPLRANTISTLLGIGISYGLNSKYTFNQVQYSRSTATKFFTVGLVGLVFSNLLLLFLLETVDMKPLLAKFITLPVVALIQFTLNKIWTFDDRLIKD